MTESIDAPASFSLDEFRVLARAAGLNIDDDRASQVLGEFITQLALCREIDPLVAGTEAPMFMPYDPAFPEIEVEDPT